MEARDDEQAEAGGGKGSGRGEGGRFHGEGCGREIYAL